MTLDITKLASQVGDMVARIKLGKQDQLEHLARAVDQFADNKINLDVLKHKIDTAHTPWPVARLWEGLNLRFPPPPASREYTVLATDGSHIAMDRHKAARCYLINIGAISLHYGENPSAVLESLPQLYSDDKELVIKNGNNKHREQQIEGALLDAKRSVAECLKMAEMAAALSPDCPAIALMDGSLVLFGMENYPQFVVEELVDHSFIPALEEIRKLSLNHELALASYISLPRSSDVINVLRVSICPHTSADCDRHCSTGDSACDAISGLNDRILFASLLKAGERSAIFINPSAILKRYGKHSVYFFYLKTADEIARIEVPEWVAMNESLVSLTHSLVLDQCRRGQGYPVALSEAHEKAVVTGADREEFWGLVEEVLEDEKIPTYTSGKNQSKRNRWI